MTEDRAPIVPADSESIATAAKHLREGGLIAFPTETVYGLGADATNGEAVARVFAAKQRPQFNPLIVHGQVHGALGQANPSGTDNGARSVEGLHHHLESPILRTEQIAGRNEGIIELKLG